MSLADERASIKRIRTGRLDPGAGPTSLEMQPDAAVGVHSKPSIIGGCDGGCDTFHRREHTSATSVLDKALAYEEEAAKKKAAA